MTCGIYYFWDDLKDNFVYIEKSIDIEKLDKKVRNKNLSWEVL